VGGLQRVVEVGALPAARHGNGASSFVWWRRPSSLPTIFVANREC
jgi:hypothetical protein